MFFFSLVFSFFPDNLSRVIDAKGSVLHIVLEIVCINQCFDVVHYTADVRCSFFEAFFLLPYGILCFLQMFFYLQNT